MGVLFMAIELYHINNSSMDIFFGHGDPVSSHGVTVLMDSLTLSQLDLL